jgi:hypothetical protein
MITVVETLPFIRQAERLLSRDERDGIITFLSRRPKAGVVIRGAGGIRKIRWAKGDQGKSNLTAEECSQLAALVDRLTSIWLRKKR